VSDASFALGTRTRLNVSGPIRDRDAVKIQVLALVTKEYTVAATIVKRLDDAQHTHEEAMEPWPKMLTMANALSADSRPLLVSSGIDRSSAWLMVLVVSTPKITGTRVLS
jgi:hypothetical protein